ncbi:MAG: spore germination protein [Ectobacillus sp.]
MAPRIQKVKIVNNSGIVNFGTRCNLSPVTFAKTYSGSGASSEAEILNGRRTKTEAMLPPEEIGLTELANEALI